MYRVEGKKKMSTNNKPIQFFVPADVVDQFKINLNLSKQRSQQVIDGLSLRLCPDYF